jgi:ADP-heptose:LPS heptosyltransferase
MNILAFRNDRFGEFLLNIPAFYSLKKRYPESRLILVVDSYVRDLAKAIYCVDEVIVWERRKHSLAEIIRFAKVLRKEKFDISIAFNPSKESNIVSFLSGIKKRIGYKRKWGFLLNTTILDKKHEAQKHEVEYNLELTELAGCRTHEKQFKLNVSGVNCEILTEKFKEKNIHSIISVHPFTSDPIKQWNLERFKELILLLSKDPQTAIVIVGGALEAEKNNDFLPKADNIINLAGKTNLLELASILKKSKVLISCDSGPMHLAASIDTPVVAIFRSDIIGKSAKRWGPWGGKHKVIEKDSLDQISPQAVLRSVNEIK